MIVPTEFIKLYSILTLFCIFKIQMKPVCGSLFDLFSNLLSLVFFLSYGYLICLTYKNNQNTMKEQSAKRQKDLSGSHSWTSLIRIQTLFLC